ncbi:hypothetical protein PRUPE_1G120000 [Prunus persica]|uniref:Uncharacterized protein n=1 Tax=Prunus persica TaxID=3760 RepID=A0A251QX67_PRUPE|nr:hypothetical protein PRUPE_1G120000 [Prunus persica]
MANNFPTGDARQPPQNIGVVPVILIEKQKRGGTLDLCDNEITATHADEVGMFNFNNMTDHTGQGGGGCTTVTKSSRNISGNKITAQGGKGVGFGNFDNCTLHKNSNDEDDAAAGGKKKSPA